MARRHDIARTRIRIWVETDEQGRFIDAVSQSRRLHPARGDLSPLQSEALHARQPVKPAA